MNEMVQETVSAEDAAWVSIETPLDVESLKNFCQDIEQLFRINPMLIFNSWHVEEKNRYLFSGQNISQEEPFEFSHTLTVTEFAEGIEINYLQGIKSSTTFKIEPAAPDSQWKSKLTITDSYMGVPEQDRQELLHTVDRSLSIWAKSLQQYLIRWHRWSHLGMWRWYMKRVWQPMRPSGRRITYMLLWITVFEIALIGLGVAIYYIEFGR